MLIATHSGKFHADDVLSVFLLKQLPQFTNASVVRTRDSSLIASADCVVDVGAIFDPNTLRFDHHQKDFNETFPESEVKLASCGLVYRHFGKEIISNLSPQPLSPPILEILYKKMYFTLVHEIDANDNGISGCDCSERKFSVSTGISSRVANLNPCWNDESLIPDVQFNKAVEMVGSEFVDRLLYYINNWLPARTIVENSFNTRFSVHSSGRIMFLSRPCPWKEHLFSIEEENGITQDDNILFVLFADNSSGSSIRVSTVPVQNAAGFENRKTLLNAWWGLRDASLCDVAGLPDAQFVHATGFIGSAVSFDSALKMAVMSFQ
ncbi:hypothetical protein RCL1_005284 [Eukaryota sp. TZLM3-RCL]